MYTLCFQVAVLALCGCRAVRVAPQRDGGRERRNQLRHPRYAAPELLARRPNELWSWDITKLRGPVKWTYFYLYVMLDVFSRYVVGWMVAHRESATLDERFIHETCARQGIAREQLTIDADRGSAMTSKSVAFLLADLGITKTHSRPHVSDDNPFSEAQFKTLKYRPAFPERFGAIQDARAHCHVLFPWYNTEHHHTGLGLLTPPDVHHGLAEQRVAARAAVLATAYGVHPEHFPGGLPQPPARPTEAWINPPHAPSDRGGAPPLNSATDCLILIDRFRPAEQSSRRSPLIHCHHGQCQHHLEAVDSPKISDLVIPMIETIAIPEDPGVWDRAVMP
jgi:putative transposase